MVWFVLLCVIIWGSNGVAGFPEGAPCASYEHMHPKSQHGPDNNDGKTAPYEVLFLDASSKEVSCYSPGKKYTVRVQPKSSSDTLSGFLIQGRDSNDNPVGKFDVSGDAASVMQYQCQHENSVTHIGKKAKPKVDAHWSTDDEKGVLRFKATVVRELTDYYVKIPSKPISVC